MSKTAAEPQGCLAVILSLFGIRVGSPGEDKELPYRQRDDFLSQAEFSFYRVLSRAMEDRAVICPKVGLGDIFFVVRQEGSQAYRNKIDRKHVDFLICDPQTMSPRLGIELDDASHRRPDRQQRDRFVDQVFEAAGLPLVRFAAQATYNPANIQAKLMPFLEGGQAVASPTATGSAPPTCPKCGVPMVERVARKGKNAGQSFLGCPNYPKCKETVQA